MSKKVNDKDIDEVTGAFATIIKSILRIWEMIKAFRAPKETVKDVVKDAAEDAVKDVVTDKLKSAAEKLKESKK